MSAARGVLDARTLAVGFPSVHLVDGDTEILISTAWHDERESTFIISGGTER